MPVPDFQTLMLPVLRQYDGAQVLPSRAVRDAVGGKLGLTDDEQSELLASGRQTRFGNRIAWAHVYLKHAGLLSSPRRGYYQITESGREVLVSPPSRIDIAFLMRYSDFVAFRAGGSDVALGSPAEQSGAALTPDEQIRAGYQRLRAELAAQLLERSKNASPQFFEDLVVDLLVAMGYGGTHEDAARVVGRSGDGGIDGIIKEDRLGFESIYVQAKRWEGSVGRPTIQQFAGALQGIKARKGIVLTTSTFTRDAIEYAHSVPATIILIDGPQLAQLMIDYSVGVSEVQTLKLVKVDEDFFSEE